MEYSQTLAMITDFIEAAMTRDFKIDGGVAREIEADNALVLRFGFVGKDDFANRGKLEFFCNAVERAAQTLSTTMAQNEEDAAIGFDREQGALYARDAESFIDLLEALSVQQNLAWAAPATHSDQPLSTAFRQRAERALQNDPEVLLRLESSFNGYSSRDELYAAILREGSPGLYTLRDLRGALRSEAVIEGRARLHQAPGFWYH